MKKYTEKKAAEIVNKITRKARKNVMANLQKILGNVVYSENYPGYIACDGVRCVRLNALPGGIETQYTVRILTEGERRERQAMKDILMQKISEYFTKAQNNNLLQVDLYDEATSKTLQAGKRKKFYVTEDGQAYNVAYLADMLKVFPNASWFVHGGNRLSPLYIVDDHGEALLMPVMLDRAKCNIHTA